MQIKVFFYFIVITFLSCQMYSMKRPAPVNTFVFAPHHNPQIIKDKLLLDIKVAIEDNDLFTIEKLLSTNDAALLNKEQKNELYDYAQQVQNSASFPSQLRNLLTNYIYTFKFLPKLTFPSVVFTPQPYNRLMDKRPNLNEILNALIANEQEKIYVCCFHLTLTSVTAALVKAKNNDVSIEIITNQTQGNLPNSRWNINNLIANGLTVLSPQNDPYEQMHHKFFIFKKNLFNKSLIWVGSYNATETSNIRSWDDAIISDDPEIIAEYIKRFEEIKSRSK